MRTIVAGSRSVTDQSVVDAAILACDWTPTVIISGTARGVDTLGENWARANSVPVERFPANWNLHGKRAGYLRNQQMADNAEALVAVWDGQTRGTLHMITIARVAGLKVYIHRT